MGIPMIRAVKFDAHDVNDGQLVVIVSQSMAKSTGPARADVIGKRVTHNSGIRASASRWSAARDRASSSAWSRM